MCGMEMPDSSSLANQASDLMEQVVRVNRMIELNANDDFMQAQYRALRKDFVDQLNTLLHSVRLELTEVVA